jgi:hypothetical protein
MAPPGRTKREKNLFESRDSLPSIKYLARVLPLSSPFVTAWLFFPSSLSRPAFPVQPFPPLPRGSSRQTSLPSLARGLAVSEPNGLPTFDLMDLGIKSPNTSTDAVTMAPSTLDLFILTFNCAKNFVNPPVFAAHLHGALSQNATGLPDVVVLYVVRTPGPEWRAILHAG